MIDVSLPICLLTPDLFISLYRLGKTESDPELAVKIAFGKLDPDLVVNVRHVLFKNQPERSDSNMPPESDWSNSITTLTECGFARIGEWQLADYKSTKHLAHLPGINFSVCGTDVSSFVYAFVVDEEVVYVGESAQAMGVRFQSYRYGNPAEKDTDNRVKIYITEALQEGRSVSIWHFSRHMEIDFAGERTRIPLSKPIEELMIRRLRPVLNNLK